MLLERDRPGQWKTASGEWLLRQSYHHPYTMPQLCTAGPCRLINCLHDGAGEASAVATTVADPGPSQRPHEFVTSGVPQRTSVNSEIKWPCNVAQQTLVNLRPVLHLDTNLASVGHRNTRHRHSAFGGAFASAAKREADHGGFKVVSAAPGRHCWCSGAAHAEPALPRCCRSPDPLVPCEPCGEGSSRSQAYPAAEALVANARIALGVA